MAIYQLAADLGKSLPRIREFTNGNNRFTGSLPLSLTNLSRLQHLSIISNSFTGVLPSELGRLQNLEVFYLADNKFEANNEQEWGSFLL